LLQGDKEVSARQYERNGPTLYNTISVETAQGNADDMCT
jgi:hypothetical protein